jgi:hypothetical protein
MTHTHGNCKDLLGSLSEYVDGNLGEQLCEEIEQHMSECENCRIVIDTLKKTVSLYHESSKEPIELPAGIREQLLKNIGITR